MRFSSSFIPQSHKSVNEMIRYHHRLNGHEFEEILGNSGEQGSLVCCSSRGHEESDTT